MSSAGVSPAKVGAARAGFQFWQCLNLPPDPSRCSGFRRAAQAPRIRLNLLKKFIASTLTTLRKQRTRLLDKQLAGRVHG